MQHFYVLGFDYGTKYLGVAVGQTLLGTAKPLQVVPMLQGQPNWPVLDQLVATWRPQALVVGIPYNMDDTPTILTTVVKQFAEQLALRYNMAVDLVDERLSTREARSRYFAHNKVGKIPITVRGKFDAMAAAVIVEAWLAGKMQ